jgi:sugar phosphate isomerase/epimerase
MKLEIGLSTGIAYRHPIGEVLEPIARQGFHDLEISTAPHHLDVSDPRSGDR